VALRHTLRCAVCSEPFEASRSDAETCSPACRARRTRAAARRREEATAADVERAAALLASLRAASAFAPED
jgi:predicted nucleic acid-binding Zn ribbon protein